MPFLTKSGPTLSVKAGEEFSFTLTAGNTGGAAIQNATIVDQLPAGLVATGVSTAQCSLSSGNTVVTCPVGDLASGASKQVVITARATKDGDFTNTARMTYRTPTGPGTPLTGTWTVTVKVRCCNVLFESPAPARSRAT